MHCTVHKQMLCHHRKPGLDSDLLISEFLSFSPCHFKSCNLIHLEDHKGPDGSTYHCEVCDVICSSLIDLTSYMRVHTEEKPFMCGICDKSYRYSANIEKHIQTVHVKEKHGENNPWGIQ